jgi:hypothetical protein
VNAAAAAAAATTRSRRTDDDRRTPEGRRRGVVVVVVVVALLLELLLRQELAAADNGCGAMLFYWTAIRTTQGTLGTHTRFVVYEATRCEPSRPDRYDPVGQRRRRRGELVFLAIGYFFMDGRRESKTAGICILKFRALKIPSAQFEPHGRSLEGLDRTLA